MVSTNMFTLDIGGDGASGQASGGRGGGRGGRGGGPRPSAGGNNGNLTVYHYDVVIDPVKPEESEKELTPEERKQRNERK